CPTTINGISVFCRPNNIIAGDFDDDGLPDLVATVFTHPRSNASSVSTSGLVSAFKGDGQGGFEFSDEATVGINPKGIAAGDFDGDGAIDFAVAEQAALSVRMLNGSPPPCTSVTGLGVACHSGRCCASGFCVDGVCCNASSCPLSGGVQEFCDIPG